MKEIADEAGLFFLRVIVGIELPAPFLLRLYINDVHPTASTKAAIFVEAHDGGGYAPYETFPTDWSWSENKALVRHKWTFDGTKNLDVTGWYMTCGPAFVIGMRFKDKSGKDETQKIRRQGDWIEPTAWLRWPLGK
jgi:hypothetical protein